MIGPELSLETHLVYRFIYYHFCILFIKYIDICVHTIHTPVHVHI